MPYQIDNPPDKIKGLPKGARGIWIKSFNAAWETYDGDEERCNKVAWGVVKKVYEQTPKGEWVKMKEKELQTIDVDGVEILAVGKWHGHPKTKEYTGKDLDNLVKSFEALISAEKLNYEPPVKLGHDDDQKLLQQDGYPAAGWITSLKHVGDKLVANFKGVPKKIGDIIKAGGYKKVSSEIYYDYEIGGDKYPVVLKAVSLLGGDIPAVKTIKDIVAQYDEVLLDEEGRAYETVIFGEDEVTLDEIMSDLDTWLSKAEGKIKGKIGSPAIRTYLKEVKAKLEVLVSKQSLNEAIEQFEAGKSSGNDNNQEKEELMEKELRELLGLSEDADVLETVKALKEKAESETKLTETVSLAEHESVKGMLTQLETKLAERARDEVIAKAITDCKIMPAQKEWADKYALSDPSGFDVFLEAQPVIMELGERGSEGGGEDVEFTEQEIRYSEQLGVSKEELAAAKKTEKEGR